jgi:hypothetical protein
MSPDGMAVVPEIPQSLSTVHSFEQGQAKGYHDCSFKLLALSSIDWLFV